MTFSDLIAKLISTFPGQVRNDGRETIAGRKVTILRGIGLLRTKSQSQEEAGTEGESAPVVKLVFPEPKAAVPFKRRF
jgi:hypothetical protein